MLASYVTTLRQKILRIRLIRCGILHARARWCILCARQPDAPPANEMQRAGLIPPLHEAISQLAVLIEDLDHKLTFDQQTFRVVEAFGIGLQNALTVGE